MFSWCSSFLKWMFVKNISQVTSVFTFSVTHTLGPHSIFLSHLLEKRFQNVLQNNFLRISSGLKYRFCGNLNKIGPVVIALDFVPYANIQTIAFVKSLYFLYDIKKIQIHADAAIQFGISALFIIWTGWLGTRPQDSFKVSTFVLLLMDIERR